VFSKRKYSYLGGIRSRVSNIRFEIIFSLNILVFILYRNNYQINYLINIGLYLFFLVFILNILVETFRAPFDYAESERELVRGFNTEYSSVSFVLIFLKEYRSIIFFCVFTSVIFFNGRI
jgi:NADH:ubiquinone oxidoreductase subunit H